MTSEAKESCQWTLEGCELSMCHCLQSLDLAALTWLIKHRWCTQAYAVGSTFGCGRDLVGSADLGNPSPTLVESLSIVSASEDCRSHELLGALLRLETVVITKFAHRTS